METKYLTSIMNGFYSNVCLCLIDFIFPIILNETVINGKLCLNVFLFVILNIGEINE